MVDQRTIAILVKFRDSGTSPPEARKQVVGAGAVARDSGKLIMSFRSK